MKTSDTVALLEDAANRIADVSRPDLQIILRRAALLLRNSGSIAFDTDIEEALRDLSGEFGKTRNDTVRFIVREWMEKNAYLPVHSLEEDGDVDGNA
ncbi:CopG family transcriptional regulator [Rhizobium sp. H4]|uniref:CopG family transcriptional regulator n=1 Tax=Rhizobium sp. H4 TaxID=2035449 RepID=UPI000BE8AC97|nr:CopG family transcriptional regulator [Rhizobium sp. H4]PDV89958.1 CopG family transcriptional regulator [Rhizobium sp. H4]